MIAGAAADVAGQHLAHFMLGRRRMLAQELRGRDQDAGGAEAALQGVVPPERLLQIIELPLAWAQPFDSLDTAAVHLHCITKTRAHRPAVEQRRARAAE